MSSQNMLNQADGHVLAGVFACAARMKLSPADQEAFDRAIEAIVSENASQEDVAQAFTLVSTVLSQAAKPPRTTAVEHLQAAGSEAWRSLQEWYGSVVAEVEPVVREKSEQVRTAANQASEAARDAGNRLGSLVTQGTDRLKNAWAALCSDRPAAQQPRPRKKAAMKKPKRAAASGKKSTPKKKSAVKAGRKT